MARTIRSTITPKYRGVIREDYYRGEIRAERRAAKRAERRFDIGAWFDAMADDVAPVAPVVAPVVKLAPVAPVAPVVTFTTVDGDRLILTIGTTVVIGWAGYNGNRGADATHRTETVVAVTASAVTLTGGAYKGNAETRVLALRTAKGTPTRQIRGTL